MNTTVSRTAIVIAVVIVLLSGSFPVYADSSTGSGLETPVPAPAAIQPGAITPVINVWYSSALNFGQIGNPQTQVNILGNVSDPGGVVQSLNYRLNGGAAMPLTIGPDGLRLVNKGDFDAAINISSLLNGQNTMVLTAKNSSGGAVATKTVTFSYAAGRTWPLPYTTNWAGAANISDRAQVVDGLWQLSASGVRPTQIGYDRLIAIGDMSWTDYEVLVPITVYGFTPDPTKPTDEGGVGLIVRWLGHGGSGQPPSDWTEIGAYAYYSKSRNAWTLRWNGTDLVTTTSFPFSYNTTYLYKLRVETISSTSSRYSFKAWVKGLPEPSWSSSQFSKIVNVVDAAETRPQGSMLLVAHRADATFGDVTVCPLNLTYPLSINTSGSGTVTSAPTKTNYACGEGVTLTAQPNPGWNFKGWSGDLASSSTSLSFNMTKSYTLTANFTSGQPVDLNNRVFLPLIER